MKLLGGVLLLLVTPVVVAEGIERQFESHEHGKASMTVVLEGNTLQIEINSPAADIVGFEHAPVNEQQRDALHSVIQQLKKPEQLFTFPEGSECLPDLAEVETAMMNAHNEKEDHEEDHDHEADHDHEGQNHSDLQLSYQFQCGSPERLNGFSVDLFKYYPQMILLQVQLIGPSGQSYQSLDEGKRWINL